MERAHHATLVVAYRFNEDEINVGVLELRDQLAPSIRIVDETQIRRTQAHVEVMLAHIGTSVLLPSATCYLTLRMYIHD